MCDTFVALPAATSDGSVIVGKNSDREPNEAQELLLVPAADHAPGSVVRATYLSIPQAGRTHAVLLAKPFWIWGGEMGVNEHGVVIGNEAVFTTVPHEKAPGLIGMDLLRLALERGATADEALAVITEHLTRYGQGGNCGHSHTLRYHNSFVVADPSQAWILETAGREWVAARVSRFGSISNALTLGAQWEAASPRLGENAPRRRRRGTAGRVDVAATYSDRLRSRLADAEARRCRTHAGIAAAAGSFGVADAMALLRDHGDTSPGWSPPSDLLGTTLLGTTVCWHAGLGPVRGSQSVGSMVAHLPPGKAPTVWLTGTSAPCTSVFKPVWVDGGLPDLGPRPGHRYDPESLWWRHEDLHRLTLGDYARGIATYADDRDALEHDLRRRAAAAVLGSSQDRGALTASAFDAADRAEAGWLRSVQALPTPGRRWDLQAMTWRRYDRQAGRR